MTAAITIFISCSKTNEEGSKIPAELVSVKVSLTPPDRLRANTDSTIVLKLEPEDGTIYYSYLVTEGERREGLDKEKLLEGLYDGISKGKIDYAKQPVTEIVIKNLVPNTMYQVYAVSINKQGVIGDITNASITTTNNLIPTPVSFQVANDRKSLTVLFNEQIVRGDGKAYITYYPVNQLDDSIRTNLIEIPNKNIIIEGKQVTFVPTMTPAGAYINIIWEDNFVKNLVNTPAVEYKKKGFNASDPTKSAGITYRLPITSFNIYAMTLNQSTNKYEKMKKNYLKYFDKSNECVLNVLGDSSIVKVANSFSSYSTFKGKSRAIKVDLSRLDVNPSNGMMTISLPEECPRGYTADYSIGTGMFEDRYGNKSKEITTSNNFVRTYGLTVDDIIGVYSASATSYWGGQMTENNIIIQKHATSKDSVIIRNLASTNQKYMDFVKKNNYTMVDYEIPAYFNGITGDLKIAAGYGISNAKSSTGATPFYIILANSDQNITTLDFEVTAPRTISFAKNKGMIGYLLYNASTEASLGYLDLYTSMKLTYTSPQSSNSNIFNRALLVNSSVKSKSLKRVK